MGWIHTNSQGHFVFLVKEAWLIDLDMGLLTKIGMLKKPTHWCLFETLAYLREVEGEWEPLGLKTLFVYFLMQLNNLFVYLCFKYQLNFIFLSLNMVV